MRKLILLMLPVLMLLGGGSAALAEGGAVLGSIVCTKSENFNGKSYLVFSQQDMDCTYHGVGGPQKYKGVEGILLGIDLEGRYKESMTFFVIGGTWKDAASLEGKYIGVQVSASAIVGVTVQGGLVGVGNNITLVPLGLGGGIGLGANAGLSYLSLTSVD